MKRWIFLFVVVVILGSLIGWRLTLNRANAMEQKQMQKTRLKAPAEVSVAAAVTRNIVETFDTVGALEAPLNIKIAPKVTGLIDYLTVLEGNHVHLGQVLVRLDDSEITAQVDQDQSALAEAQYRLAQAKLTQNPTNVSATTQISQQYAAVNSAQANYNQASQNYNAQVAAAEANVQDAQSKVNSALASLASANAGLQSAEANLNDSKSHLSRYQNLYKQGYVAAQDIDDATAQVSVQQASVLVAKAQINAAHSAVASAEAQLNSAQKQADIVRTSGKAAIESTQAQLHQAQASLKYARSNTAQIPAYKENLAALKATVDAARATLNNMIAQKANTVLFSPVDGYVVARDMDPGSMATPGTPILELQTMRQVWATIPVPEEINSKIYFGQQAEIRCDALPGKVFIGKVTQINTSADPLSRQFTIRVTLANPDNQLRPGMFARVHMILDKVTGNAVVPREAVLPNPKGGQEVFVVTPDNTAKQISVRTGAQDARGIAILNGVKPGDKVIVLSAMPVKDGQKVRIGSSHGEVPMKNITAQ
jgi:HlyD family secretion protein